MQNTNKYRVVEFFHLYWNNVFRIINSAKQ